MFGLAIVDRHGRSAGRLRVRARSLIVWAPCVGLLFLSFEGMTKEAAKVAFLWSCLFYVLLMIVPALHQAGGPHDAVTGTRVVPR